LWGRNRQHGAGKSSFPYFKGDFAMKKMFLVATAFLTLSGTAFAEDFICGGNNCFDSYQGITVGGSANFGGFGAGVFTGDEGGVKIEKVGSAMTDLKLNLAGDTCGLDCQDGGFTFSASAMESLSVLGAALGTQSGQTVSVVNEGGVFSHADFNFGRINVGGSTE
jgi:hypothetical protein